MTMLIRSTGSNQYSLLNKPDASAVDTKLFLIP